MPMFRKKPVVIQAIQYVEVSRRPMKFADHVERNGMDVARFVGRPLREATIPNGSPDGRTVLEIETLEGVMQADVGDWIIRGVKGEFYPCKPDIFAATYESV